MTKEKIKDAVYTRRYIYNFHYHLIWVTKYRNKTFTTDALANEMKEILSGIAEANKIVIENMEVMPDHVHMLISFPPSKAPTSAIKALKGRSAYMFLKRHPEIRQSQYWGGHLWSPSYYISTLGNMSKDVVERYINDQKYNETKKRPNGTL
ncbi:IS200/IS605 family transposase [Lactobacillus salivarius]|uniref:IS200/IS605 family transposase n=1 Tax=Ligilactobacillus salivarius TaxID=1624 RepID=UPI0015C5A725|nr:IS200/IS605 family transposase [Ligilactobacillus salivarius]NXZ96185.1 IS200/IS605 family transposase [Ligilactobacillus salivarius]NYA59469.1 IS200/IS605 family transposase [Ligilactobacillus salivarius]NYA60843.1 IS200/IS605 family transposase [Ligilactobacillus salivarius]NYA62763.1 IS200/IS605 family transposase [Ligilactobacillus salivarius]NYA66162.1 IS200/IS605 family transposase [Ligilactobacillus salivarius]